METSPTTDLEKQQDHVHDAKKEAGQAGDSEQAESPEQLSPATTPPPDGGFAAWSVVVGAFIANFAAFGVGNSAGVYQRAFTSDPASAFLRYSPLQLGFVGGCMVGFAFIAGPFSNVLTTTFGVRAPVLLGFVCMALGLELASISSQLWELLLSQGILYGIGASLVFIPAIGLPSQWFSKRRSLATGISSAGTGIGAIVFSQVAQIIIDKPSLGIAWSQRVLGFIIIALALPCAILLRRRITPSATKVQYKLFDWKVLQVRGYALFLLAALTQMWGYTVPIFQAPSFCATIGINAHDSATVVTLIAAGNTVGRIASGFLADKFGVLNVLTSFTFISGLLCLFLWQFARSLAAMIVFALTFGFFAGAFWSLSVPSAASIVGLEKLGSATSTFFLALVVPPIFSIPIASSIVTRSVSTGYATSPKTPEAYAFVAVFAGLVYIFSGACLLIVRSMLGKGMWAKQ